MGVAPAPPNFWTSIRPRGMMKQQPGDQTIDDGKVYWFDLALLELL